MQNYELRSENKVLGGNMKKYLLWFLLVMFLGLFVHSYNKNRILSYNKMYAEKKELLASLTSVNKDLIRKYNHYSSAEYIQKHAIEDLGMVFPSANDKIENIVFNKAHHKYINVFSVQGNLEASTIK